ncbi:Uncharacterised protein [Mycobacterium tuberculosis]|nr:Uncharacterised protein [Mycobacterium tuberculosis]
MPSKGSISSAKKKAINGTVNMNTLKFMGLPMYARSLFTPHPTARPTRVPIRNEKKNIPDAVPRVSS